MMVSSEHEPLRTPFDSTPLHLWPWDFKRVFNFKRQLESIEREVSLYPHVLPPSTRTKKSAVGMKEWRVWVKRTEVLMKTRKQTDTELFDIGSSADFYAVFDYKTMGCVAYEHKTQHFVIEKLP